MLGAYDIEYSVGVEECVVVDAEDEEQFLPVRLATYKSSCQEHVLWVVDEPVDEFFIWVVFSLDLRHLRCLRLRIRAVRLAP